MPDNRPDTCEVTPEEHRRRPLRHVFPEAYFWLARSGPDIANAQLVREITAPAQREIAE